MSAEVERQTEAHGALDAHFRIVSRALGEGRVVPFLGAAVNRCGRPQAQRWEPGTFDWLPTGDELAGYLAAYFGYPETDPQNLVRVSQYVVVMTGREWLYEQLRTIFNGDYPPTSAHRFLAALPATLLAKGYPISDDPIRRRLVIVTTNYDDVMERALTLAGERFHTVSYVAEGDGRGKFLHRSPDGADELIERPNEYVGLLRDQAPIVVKIHGAVDRLDPEHDSFVITEDHYIDYLTRTDIATLLPVPLPAKLQKSHFLFMGYSLSDWNLRAILHRLAAERRLDSTSWAVQLAPTDLDKRFWGLRKVEIVDADLADYVVALEEGVRNMPAATRRAGT